jgi:hypothetical protein
MRRRRSFACPRRRRRRWRRLAGQGRLEVLRQLQVDEAGCTRGTAAGHERPSLQSPRPTRAPARSGPRPVPRPPCLSKNHPAASAHEQNQVLRAEVDGAPSRPATLSRSTEARDRARGLGRRPARMLRARRRRVSEAAAAGVSNAPCLLTRFRGRCSGGRPTAGPRRPRLCHDAQAHDCQRKHFTGGRRQR